MPNSDSQPSGPPEIVIPEEYRPKADAASLATNGPAATVYFAPQDEDTSTTVLFLYNTGDASATVGLQTFRTNGSIYVDTTINVPAHYLVRICADTVDTASSSWQDAILVNFRTSSAYGKLTLPPGVKADGYVVWNNGTTYDPLQIAPTLPLRFTADPATIFLPTVQGD